MVRRKVGSHGANKYIYNILIIRYLDYFLWVHFHVLPSRVYGGASASVSVGNPCKLPAMRYLVGGHEASKMPVFSMYCFVRVVCKDQRTRGVP